MSILDDLLPSLPLAAMVVIILALRGRGPSKAVLADAAAGKDLDTGLINWQTAGSAVLGAPKTEG